MNGNGHDFRVIGCPACYRDPSGKVWPSWSDYAASFGAGQVSPALITGTTIAAPSAGGLRVAVSAGVPSVTVIKQPAGFVERVIGPPLVRTATNGNGNGTMIVSRHQLSQYGVGNLGVQGDVPYAVQNLDIKKGLKSAGKWALKQLGLAAGKEIGTKLKLPGTAVGNGTATPLTDACPQGYEPDGKGGCQQVGISGAIARRVPGGSAGRLTADYGAAVIGAFGQPALEPRVAGTVMRRDGTTGAVLRCPGGMVLGKDDLCYPRGVIGRRGKFRKHRPSVRPPLSSADTAAIRRAARAKDRVKELAKDVGFTCKKR